MSSEHPRDWVDIFGAVAPVIQSMVILGVGVFFTDRVSTALQREQLDLSHITEMRQLLLDLQRSNVTEQEATAAALTLAAFGPHAIAPLTNVVQVAHSSGLSNQARAAEVGLRAVGSLEPGPVCDHMEKLLRDRGGLFDWRTHGTAIDLLADLGCSNQAPVLKAYKAALEVGGADDALHGLRSRVNSDDLVPDAESVMILKQKLSRALTMIERIGGEGP